MSKYTFLARIVDAKTKDGDLAVKFAAGSFFFNETNICKLKNKIVHVVPPVIDFPRNLKIKSISSFKGLEAVFSVSEVLPTKSNHKNIKDYDLSLLAGSNLLILKNDLLDAVGDSKHFQEVQLIDVSVVDNKYGYLGKVANIEGSMLQSVLCVEQNDSQILIPFVDSFVVQVLPDKIIVDVPKSLIELNE